MLCAPVYECRLLVAPLSSVPIEVSATERQEDRLEERYSNQVIVIVIFILQQREIYTNIISI